jgi:glycogen debranching enzyme
MVRKNFGAKFWNESADCLFDCLQDDGPDPSIRPNQIFAVSLRHGIVENDRARRIVDVVRRDLLTPLGLRTLAPVDPSYRPVYKGGVTERDSAYHQGTVWPWLIGAFITAYVKVHRGSDESRRQAAAWLEPFADHLGTGCLGQIAEIADGDPPHTPRGCVAQAWSVAEVLRALVQDVHNKLRSE